MNGKIIGWQCKDDSVNEWMGGWMIHGLKNEQMDNTWKN